jgi:hypothetical protein
MRNVKNPRTICDERASQHLPNAARERGLSATGSAHRPGRVLSLPTFPRKGNRKSPRQDDTCWRFAKGSIARPSQERRTSDPRASREPFGGAGGESGGVTPALRFRWGSTKSYHGQAWMPSPADTAWYRDAPDRIPPQGTAIRIAPALDAEAEALVRRCQLVG